MCHINPNNVQMLRYFGQFLIFYSLISIIIGKIYTKWLIVRDEEPVTFWVTVILVSLLGLMCWIGTYVCQG